MTDEATNSRLERIEDKLDKLTDAISALARVEERQAQQRDELARVWRVIEKLVSDVNGLHHRVGVGAAVGGGWVKVGWLLLGAAVSGAFAMATR